MDEKRDYEKYKKLQNKETAIAALELIEQHFGMTSPIYLFKTRDLSKSENHEILDAMFMHNPRF